MGLVGSFWALAWAEKESEMDGSSRVRVAIIGATGYTGAELLRLLHGHAGAEVSLIIGQSKAGQPVAEVLPSFAGVIDGEVEAFDADRVAELAEVAFCALPHGASAKIVGELREKGLTVFDLSADFRLRDRTTNATWYGDHGAPELFGQAVYGLVEFYRDALREANLVAVPGCYPTASILAVAPLLSSGLASVEDVIIDAKSGVSGAGRTARPHTHLPEAAGGIRAYKAGGLHRHTPEIEQELGAISGEELRISFTPHLVPMTRGILVTAYAKCAAPGVTAEDCHRAAESLYAQSPSVVVLPVGKHPDTLWVAGSNRVHVSYAVDERAGRIVAQASIDNLIKGAAGQAVQAFNVRFGMDEGMGLSEPGAWP